MYVNPLNDKTYLSKKGLTITLVELGLQYYMGDLWGLLGHGFQDLLQVLFLLSQIVSFD